MYTIADLTIPKILGVAEALGVEPTRLAGKPGVAVHGALIPCARLFTLYEAAARLSGDEGFGLRVGEASDLSTFGAAGAQVMESATLGEAAVAMVRVMPMLGDGITLDLRLQGGRARLSSHIRPGLVPSRHTAEATLSILVNGLRSLGWSEALRGAEVAFPRPRRLDAYDRALGVPIRFESDVNALWLDRSALEGPLGGPGLRLPAKPDIEAPTQAGRVYDAVADGLMRSREVGLGAIARDLGTSARSLQRRLQSESTSHAQILDAVRRDLAVQLLERRLGAIDEVAWRLGFSEPSPFYRAFRRWTGTSPRGLQDQ